MKRKKQIIIYLLLMVLCVESYMWLNDLRWSPKAVFAASQKMDHVGPVDEILIEVDYGDGKYAILSRTGENLYYCGMKRTKGLFWEGTGREYFTRAYLEEYDQIILARYYWNKDFLFGICREPEAKEVSFQLVDPEGNFLMEGKLPVREDGIFFGANIRGRISDEAAHPYHLRALDAEGNIIAGEVEGVL
ncbi:hypothetical protein [Anaerotignum sp.]|uniref:hypothetical protein n=1 Tax=Anaerotignum sp. TaxID=2039241 RepID=UPI003735A726